MNDEPDPEFLIRTACNAEDYVSAATLAIETYGAEILAFLIARLRSESKGDDVYGAFAEKLWVGLPQFEWRSSLRSWVYRLARNAANDYATAAQNRPQRNVALSLHPSLSQLIDRVRSATQAYRRTEVKDRVRELREQLSPDDQMLLILRVDRDMSWRDLALAMTDATEPLDGTALDKEASRLRKRFERVKERIRELAVAEGLI